MSASSRCECPQLAALDSALAHLPWSDVKRMAIHLHHSLTLSVLDQIGEDRSTAAERRMYCMEQWMKNDLDASWVKLVTALREINHNHLAQDLEARYCAAQCQPQPPDVCTPALSVSRAQSGIAGSCSSQTSWSLDAQACSPTPSITDADMIDQESGEVEVFHNLDKVQKGFLWLEERFVSIVTHVQCYLCEREVESRKFFTMFRITVINLPLSSKFKHMHFLKEKKALIKAAKDVSEIFEVLSPYWNHVDYGLLERITMEFGDGNVKREMKAYISRLIQFEKHTTVQKFVDATCDDRQIPPEFRTILIKLKRKPSNCTLYDIRIFKESLLCRASFNAYSVYLKKVGISSILVTLAVPSEGVRVFVEVIQDLQFETDTHIESLWVHGHYNPIPSLSESDSNIYLWTPVALLSRPHSPPPYKPPPPYPHQDSPNSEIQRKEEEGEKDDNGVRPTLLTTQPQRTVSTYSSPRHTSRSGRHSDYSSHHSLHSSRHSDYSSHHSVHSGHHSDYFSDRHSSRSSRHSDYSSRHSLHSGRHSDYSSDHHSSRSGDIDQS